MSICLWIKRSTAELVYRLPRSECRTICPVRTRRIGRLLERCSRVAPMFDIRVKEQAGRLSLSWKLLTAYSEWARLSEGCYLLRSNIADWPPEDLWTAYIQLTEAKAAFRIHKQDPGLRPIWHQRGNRVQAHILVCFLAGVD